jgi:hypothetical protein
MFRTLQTIPNSSNMIGICYVKSIGKDYNKMHNDLSVRTNYYIIKAVA